MREGAVLVGRSVRRLVEKNNQVILSVNEFNYICIKQISTQNYLSVTVKVVLKNK